MRKYIKSSELSGQALQNYINKIQKEVKLDLEDIVADLDWSMRDDNVYLSVTFKDDNFTNSVFIFEPWRFTGMTSYIPEDVDMVVRTVQNFAKKRKLFNEPYWEELDRKTVLDSDGFITDYTLYYNEDEGRYVCIFGDSDYYTPENSDPDFECETEREAREWFDSYRGPGEEDDDWMEEESIKSSVDVGQKMNATQVVVWMYEEFPDWAFYDEHELADGRIMLKFELGPKNQREDLEEALDEKEISYVIRNQLNIFAPEDSEYEGVESSSEIIDMGLGDDVEYWYFTTHGVQPGSVPHGLVINQVIDKPEGTYFSANRVISTDALKYYDIKERALR